MNYFLIKFLPFVIFSLPLTVPSFSQELNPAKIALIKERISEYLSQHPPEPGEVRQMLNTMNPDGSWPGIEYSSVQVANWPAINHLRNYVIPMSKAYTNPASPMHQDEELSEAIHLSLGYWLDHNFTSRNWWSNDIGVPMALTDILMMMDDEISLQEFLKATN